MVAFRFAIHDLYEPFAANCLEALSRRYVARKLGDLTNITGVYALGEIFSGVLVQVSGIRKAYVTSVGHATHYEFHCRIGEETPQSSSSRLFIAEEKIDSEIIAPWDGLGMRGNSSSPVRFTGFVPDENRLGPEHTVLSITDKFVRPLIGLTYAAAYLGIASGAFEIAVEEMPRQYHSGARRLDSAINQRRVAELGTQIEPADCHSNGILRTLVPG